MRHVQLKTAAPLAGMRQAWAVPRAVLVTALCLLGKSDLLYQLCFWDRPMCEGQQQVAYAQCSGQGV